MVLLVNLKKYCLKGSYGFVILMLLSFTNCVTTSQTQKNSADSIADTDQRIREAIAARPPKPAPADGSLWEEEGAFGEMFINAKASRVGDIVTIKIVENSSASNKAATSTGRSSDLNAGLSGFLGAEDSFASSPAFFNPFKNISGSIGSNYDGSGTTQRSGALSAYMTARIVDVLENGNLYIQGNREVRVNHENQVITLSGIVRPRDISAENVIQSTYIADAQISYSGTGIVNDRQKPGWLVRIMDKVWPF